MNALLDQYAIGHWTLTVDLDAFFVYPFMGDRSFQELLAYLDDCELSSLYTLLVDMYPKGAIASAHVPIGESPLKHAPYFDRMGYYSVKGSHGDTWTRGGPRLRAFNASTHEVAPALNKIPLIKWQRRFAYHLSTHVAYPTFLNRSHNSQHDPTGALLHFKFVSSFREKIDQAIKHNNHYDDSKEYKKYLAKLKTSEDYTLYSALSEAYTGPESLIAANLMTPGAWR